MPFIWILFIWFYVSGSVKLAPLTGAEFTSLGSVSNAQWAWFPGSVQPPDSSKATAQERGEIPSGVHADIWKD